jgi:hypothetical protein
MSWTVDGKTKRGVLRIALRGSVTAPDMAEFARAHKAAIDAFGESEYSVFSDLRELAPLSAEASAEFERAKSLSAQKKNFRGSAVLVSDKVVSLQHQRTSLASGIRDEFISDNEALCWAHLSRAKCSMKLFPIITFEIREGAMQEDYAAMFDAFQLPHDAGVHVSLTDTTGVRGMPDPASRRYIAQRQAALDAAHAKRSLGAVLVSDSMLIRGAMTAISWVNSVQVRQHFAATRLEGMQTCVAWLEEAKVTIPPSVRAYMRALERDPRARFP